MLGRHALPSVGTDVVTPLGNYVTTWVGNYLVISPFGVGNYRDH